MGSGRWWGFGQGARSWVWGRRELAMPAHGTTGACTAWRPSPGEEPWEKGLSPSSRNLPPGISCVGPDSQNCQGFKPWASVCGRVSNSF